jgi:hypothetical protein
MDNSIEILGILIREPETKTHKLQDLMTSYGCNIRTRLGLNGSEYNKNGLILLELKGDLNERENFVKKLRLIPGLEVQQLEF